MHNQVEIGKSIVSERFPNTIDEFWFIINANMIINSFDFVSVNNLHQTTTIGIVKEVLSTFLSNQEIVSHTNNLNKFKKQDSLKKNKSNLSMEYVNTKKEVVVARVAIMGNTYAKIKGNEDLLSVNFPVGASKTVRFANSKEIMFLLEFQKWKTRYP